MRCVREQNTCDDRAWSLTIGLTSYLWELIHVPLQSTLRSASAMWDVEQTNSRKLERTIKVGYPVIIMYPSSLGPEQDSASASKDCLCRITT